MLTCHYSLQERVSERLDTEPTSSESQECSNSDSDSDESMNNHGNNRTPIHTPPGSDSGDRSPARLETFARLSMDDGHQKQAPWTTRGRESSQANTSKRAASSELVRPPERKSSVSNVCSGYAKPSRRPQVRKPQPAQPARRIVTGRPSQSPQITSQHTAAKAEQLAAQYFPMRQTTSDSGYASQPPSRHNTSIETKYDMLKQPISSPISQGQLANEIKGIYGGLVMVEAKCMSIDENQAKDLTKTLNTEQWQALIALHRTLLYEHHDFLMATQHPSATPAIRGLATKYHMPARMWRHGIHSFLEVLRHRRPESQEYMLAFIYLAYQMMALLYETVPAFTDTWIECLGDLARYRMAIEDDKEVHTLWGGVASRWYSTASDRHPAIGRLYHHLGILEKPSVLKLFLYGKSLTCSSPFQNARDSLLTLCSPIVKGGQVSQNNQSWVEAATLTFYANALMGGEESVSQLSSDAISVLRKEPAAHLTNTGAFITITSIAHLLEFGSTTNKIFQLFRSAATEASWKLPHSTGETGSQASSSNGGSGVFDVVVSDVPGVPGVPGVPAVSGVSSVPPVSSAERTWCSLPVYHHYCAVLNSFLDRTLDSNALPDLLPTIHTILVWLHSIHSLLSRNHDDHDLHTISPLLNGLSWRGLATFLNHLKARENINMQTQGFTQQALFARANPGNKPILLPEDHHLRGLLWTQSYHPPGWFDHLSEDDDRFEQTDTVHKLRTSRVLLLALKLASYAQHLRYDMQSGLFWTPQPAQPLAPSPRDGETSSFGPLVAAATRAARPGLAADSIRFTQATTKQPKHSYPKMNAQLPKWKNGGRDHPRDPEVYEGDFTGATLRGDYKYEFG